MKKFVVSASVVFIAALLLVPGIVAEDAAGKALYDKKCAMCHGKDGVAKKMGAGSADLNDPAWQETATVESIIKVTAEGAGKMPGYEGKLSAEEIKQIAEYVKTL